MFIMLTEAEAEFVLEMETSDDWQSFDPDFLQKDINRLIRRNYVQKKGKGRDRQYRWLLFLHDRQKLYLHAKEVKARVANP